MRPSDDPFAERDDDEESVSLGDVVRVPRGAAFATLCDQRPSELDGVQHTCQDEGRADGQREEHQCSPADLRHHDRPEVGEMGWPAFGVVLRCAQPLEGHRHTHHDVAGNNHAVVERLTVVEGREHLGQAEGQDDDADHLHHRGETAHPVVLVVRRREPAVADPGPRDGEHRERKAEDAGPNVVLGHVVRQLVRRLTECDNEHQVVQQLERGGAAVRLVRIAAAQATPTVAQVRDRVAHPQDDVSSRHD